MNDTETDSDTDNAYKNDCGTVDNDHRVLIKKTYKELCCDIGGGRALYGALEASFRPFDFVDFKERAQPRRENTRLLTT